MHNPLQNRGEENRRSDEQKVLAVLDVLATIVRALFGIFGRRESDKRRSI